MADIFISHIHEDARVAEALVTFLRSKFRKRIDVFVSTEVLLGDDWLQTIRSALTPAKVVLAIFSPEAVHRPWVNFEAGGAWFAAEKVLIPLCIGNIDPTELPKPYSNIQGGHLGEDETLLYLVNVLWKILGVPGHPAPFSGTDRAVADFLAELSFWDQLNSSLSEKERQAMVVRMKKRWEKLKKTRMP
jgi:hypothetical protein